MESIWDSPSRNLSKWLTGLIPKLLLFLIDMWQCSTFFLYAAVVTLVLPTSLAILTLISMKSQRVILWSQFEMTIPDYCSFWLTCGSVQLSFSMRFFFLVNKCLSLCGCSYTRAPHITCYFDSYIYEEPESDFVEPIWDSPSRNLSVSLASFQNSNVPTALSHWHVALFNLLSLCACSDIRALGPHHLLFCYP